MKNIVINSWVLFCDKYSGENVMVKIIDKDDNRKIATVLLNLATRKGEPAKQYKMDVPYSELKQPVLKRKKTLEI